MTSPHSKPWTSFRPRWQNVDPRRCPVFRRQWLTVWICVYALVAAPVAFSQEGSATNRPKLGLALSGGGARGLAHIGVLQWLEQHRVPVDYIAGSSMGGLIGGMYAIGMSPAEIRELVETVNWEEILRGPPAYEQLTFRRKEDRRAYPNAIELGLRHGLQLPRGLNPGQAIGLLFDRLTLPYYDLASFDELPTPFRCVATDMEAAEPVVLRDGSLAQAWRATVAIPGLFTSVEQDGKVLADGGLVNNIPTDIVKDMGADIVIAIDVGTPLGDRDSLESLSGLLSQSLNVMTIENIRRNLKLADVIVWPDLGGYTSLDFKAGTAIADLGYKGAEAKASVLRRFALDEAAWQQHLTERRAKKRTRVPAPTTLRVEGVERPAAKAVSKELGEYLGQPLATERLEADLTAITGQGRYESLGYEIVHRRGRDELMIPVVAKTYGPPFVNVSIDVNSARSGNVDFSFRSRLTFLDLGGYGAEWRNDISLGSRTTFATEYYRPLGERGWFFAPRAFYDRSAADLFRGRSRVAEYRVRQAGVGLDLGYNFGRRSEWRFGYETGDIQASVLIGEPTLPDLNGTVSVASLRWAFDGQDSAIVPRRGVRVLTEADWFFDSPGATGAFPQARADLSAFKPLGRKNSLFVVGAAGTTFNQDAPPAQQFTLGGPFRLGAYHQDEFRGSHFLYASIGYLHEVAELPLLLGKKVYAGAWYEVGSAFNDIHSAPYQHTLSGGLVVETIIGPILLGGSWGEGGRGKLYFAIGRLF